MAIQYIAARPGNVVSAKEIAEQYDISFELLSKTLQLLMRKGFIQSYKGVNGGYIMVMHPSSITVADIIHAIEGNRKIVECGGEEDCSCQHYQRCTIKDPLQKIQENIDRALQSMTIAEMV